MVWHAENDSVCTFKTSPCMLATRAHAFQHVRVVPVHTGRSGRTHGEEGGGHRHTPTPTHCTPTTHTTHKRTNAQNTTQNTQGGIVSSAHQHLPTYGYHLAPEVHQRNPWISHIFSFRIDPEQHVPDSSNHALLRDTAEGISHRTVRFLFRHHNPSITNDLRVSIATPPCSLQTLRFSGCVHHL